MSIWVVIVVGRVLFTNKDPSLSNIVSHLLLSGNSVGDGFVPVFDLLLGIHGLSDRWDLYGVVTSVLNRNVYRSVVLRGHGLSDFSVLLDTFLVSDSSIDWHASCGNNFDGYIFHVMRQSDDTIVRRQSVIRGL